MLLSRKKRFAPASLGVPIGPELSRDMIARTVLLARGRGFPLAPDPDDLLQGFSIDRCFVVGWVQVRVRAAS